MNMHERLELAIQDTKDVLDDLGIEYGPVERVEVNFTAKCRWGRCAYNRVRGTYSIEISSRLLVEGVEWEAMLNTLIHEYLHAHKDRMCHTGEWKRCANLVNREYPCYNIKRCTSSEEKGFSEAEIESQYKYRIICDRCGTVSKYRKKSKIVSLIMRQSKGSSCRCGKCGSNNFTVESL